MSMTLNHCFPAMCCVVLPPSLLAQDVSLRAGRLLQCTLVDLLIPFFVQAVLLSPLISL